MKSIIALFILILFNPLIGISQTVEDKTAPFIPVEQLSNEGGNNIVSSNSIDSGLIVPNAFSPNGDGINDYFLVTGIEKYPDARLFVYTASNRKVFEKNHYGNIDFWGSEAEALWDGTNNIRGTGIVLPNGTYIYILDLANGNQKLIRLGTVFIRR